MAEYIKIEDAEFRKYLNDTTRRPRAIKAMDRIKIAGENFMKSKAQLNSVSGKNYNSIQSNLNDNGDNIKVKITAKAPYSQIAMETGRKPGKMPNPKNLERWIKLKGIGVSSYKIASKSGRRLKTPKPVFGDRSLKTLSYLIARKIAKQGTESYKKGGNKYVTATFQHIKDKLVPNALNEIVKIFIK